jgi:outer membrane lipoprotein-sorting protein
MKRALLLCLGLGAAAHAAGPTAAEVLAKVLEIDAWGLGDAEVQAHATLTDKRGSSSVLAFSSRSRRYDPPLSKSLVRFSAPADLAGAGFLQVQKKSGDDERHLFLPELKAARKISGNLRSNAFMGTDFSFADLDRRDLRDGAATLEPDETLGKYDCYRLSVAPKGDSQYSRIELWVRKDNFLPLQTQMFDASSQLLKTMTTKDVKRVSGRWFITRSVMVNHKEGHTTELTLDTVTPRSDIPDDEFTTRNLEKL